MNAYHPHLNTIKRWSEGGQCKQDEHFHILGDEKAVMKMEEHCATNIHQVKI